MARQITKQPGLCSLHYVGREHSARSVDDERDSERPPRTTDVTDHIEIVLQRRDLGT